MAQTKKAPLKKAANKKTVAKPATKAAPAKTVQKKAAAKATPKAGVPMWSTIHIFGYGETQIVGQTHNGKVANDTLKTLAPLVLHMAEKQQKGTKIDLKDTHVINIFNGAFIDFMPRSAKNKGQRFEWAAMDTQCVDKLVNELCNTANEKKQKNIFDLFKPQGGALRKKKKAILLKDIVSIKNANNARLKRGKATK